MTIGTFCSRGCDCSGALGGSACLAGPVLVIGTMRSPELGGGRLGAEIVSTPSEESVLTRSEMS